MADSLKIIPANDPLFEQAAALRFDVLHRPLGIDPATDFDDSDPSSKHLVVVRDGKVVAYGRLVLNAGSARIRHVSVEPLSRKSGLGRRIAEELVEEAKRRGRDLVWVNARFTSVAFWKHMGFQEVGGLTAAEETTMPHRRMERRLK